MGQEDPSAKSWAQHGDTPLPVHMGRAGYSGKRVKLLAALILNILLWTFFPHSLVSFGRKFLNQFQEDAVERWISPEALAHRILEKHPLIDGHDDLLFLIREIFRNQINNEKFTKQFEQGGIYGHVDIPRLEKGQMGGAFWSAYVRCPRNGSDFSDENYAPIVRATFQQLDLFQRLRARYPKYFTLSQTSTEASRAFHEKKLLISPLAIEGLHQIGNSPSILRIYHSLGVRYATLTHNCHNNYADAALTVSESGRFGASKPLWHGISERGRDVIYEMNRLGMLVDLSHVSKNTMVDALVGSEKWGGWKGSIAPPFFSHSSAYAICPHPRNVQDDVLQLVKKRNGLVMINFSPDFISCKESNSTFGLPTHVPENATLHQVVRHIRYIGELIGYDYVGIGSDYDGIGITPKGLEDVSKFPVLVAELLRQGVTKKDVIKVIGGNLLRVWKEAEAISSMMQMVSDPLEEEIRR